MLKLTKTLLPIFTLLLPATAFAQSTITVQNPTCETVSQCGNNDNSFLLWHNQYMPEQYRTQSANAFCRQYTKEDNSVASNIEKETRAKVNIFTPMSEVYNQYSPDWQNWFVITSISCSTTKTQTPPEKITLQNKTHPDQVYDPDTVPDIKNKLNYCDITWPYDEKFLNLMIYNIFPQVSFKCDYNDGKTSLNAGWSYFYHKGVIFGCMDDIASNYNPEANYQEEETDCDYSTTPPIAWCTNPNALNYDLQATEDNGTCIEKIEWCTDSTAINYNSQANVHVENLCQYPPAYTPQNITGHIPTTQVNKWATQWNVELKLSITEASINTNQVQLWDKFTVVDASTNDRTITLSIRQFDDQRLDVECTNYELTIPANAITTPQGDTNANPITGNFTVVGCQNKTDPQDPNSQNTEEENGPKHENTIKENNFYLSLYDTDEKGKVYVNLTNTIYILWFISFFLVLFFVLFWFIKNSFLWKSKR